MRRRRPVSIACALLVSLALAALSLFLFTRHNDFPTNYHPDEWSKVEQLRSPTHARNLNHPLLMIESADLVRQAWHVPVKDGFQVAVAGRWASAILASVGVVALCLAGFAAHGWVGLAIVGPAVALCPPLLVYAHYLKEDATLIGGLAVTVLGARLVVSSRRAIAQLPATIVLGVGCAMAASGKYVGVAALVPALLALGIAPLARRWLWPARLSLFVVVATAATVAINARAFDDPWRLKIDPLLQERVDAEYAHATTEHSGLALATPNVFCLRVAAAEIMPHAWAIGTLGAGALVVHAIRRRRWPITRWSLVLAAFPATFAVVLAHNIIPFERYALPLTVFGYLIAGNLAAAAIATTIDRRAIAGLATSLVAAIVIVAQGDRCVRFDRQFADDSRQRLREWLAANVPANAVVIADWYADLYGGGDARRFPDQSMPRVNIRAAAGYVGSAGPIDRPRRPGRALCDRRRHELPPLFLPRDPRHPRQRGVVEADAIDLPRPLRPWRTRLADRLGATLEQLHRPADPRLPNRPPHEAFDRTPAPAVAPERGGAVAEIDGGSKEGGEPTGKIRLTNVITDVILTNPDRPTVSAH